MNTVAPNSPSETANAKPAPTRQPPGRDGEVDLAPDPRRRRAEGRGRLAEPGVDRAQHRHHRCARRTGSRRAPGRAARDPRRAQVERRLVERDEEPEADGHRRDAERERQRGVEQRRPSPCSGRSRTRRRPPTTTAITRGRDARRAAELRDRVEGRHEQDAAVAQLAEGPVDARPSPPPASKRPLHEHARAARRGAAP